MTSKVKKDKKRKTVSELRQSAEKRLAATNNDPKDFAAMSSEKMASLVHELRVHQVELEMQNEELLRTQQELELSRMRYLYLYDLAPVGYCTISEKGLILEANLTIAGLLGAVRGALVNQPLTRFILPEDQDIYYGFHNQLCKIGSPQVCEVRMLRADAAPFGARLTATMVRNADDTSIGLITASDITEQKQTEDELLRRSEELATILDILPVTVWVCLDPECRVITGNRTANEMLGTTAGTNVSQSAVTSCRALGIKQLKADGDEYRMDELPMRRAIALGKPVGETEIRFSFPDGRHVDTVGQAAPFFDQQGRVRGAVAVFADITARKENDKKLQNSHDELEERVRERTQALSLSIEQLSLEITERQKAEERLLKSKEMLQAVFDGISDPLVLLTEDMMVKVVNKSAMAYYRITDPLKVIGEPCYKAFKGESHLCPDCKAPQAIVRGADMDFERQGFMDPLREEKVYLYILKQQDGKPADIIYRISDITERKVLEKRFVQSEKMASLGVLVSSVAHEINNPNAFISFNVPILKDYIERLINIIDKYGEAHPNLKLFRMPYSEFREDIFKLIDNIKHGSERINTFVSNLKEFSRIKITERECWIDFPTVVGKSLSICREKINKSVTSITVDIPDDLSRVHTDPIALEQILINLLMNAAQASDKEESWIRLSAAIGCSWLDHIIIEVKDNGCGIAEKDMKHVFDPFFSTKTSAEGMGLGLYVCHNLATGLGGRIEVESAAGEFSTFRVILPDMERRKEKRI